MKKTVKKLLSAILAVIMLFSSTTVTFAVETKQMIADEAGTLTISANPVNLTVSDAEQTATIYLYMDKNVQLGSAQINYELKEASSDVELKTCVSSLSGKVCNLGSFSQSDMSGAYATYNETLQAYEILSVPVVISAGAQGKYEVVFTISEFADADYSEDYTLASNTVTATITVEEAKETAPYEIFYTLSGSTFSGNGDTDEYTDYNIGDPVKATVYIKNNTNAAVSLQAYDIYLTHASNLTIGTFTPKNDSKGILVTDSDGKLHLQAFGTDTKTEGVSEININLPADGTAVELGTLTFAFNSAAVYDEELHITLADNSAAKAEGSTAIGIANYKEGSTTETTGNKTAYYPAVIGDVLGAEVMTKYTVTYADGVDGEEITVPDAQTKYYNQTLTLSSTVPTREGWSFTGWNTEADGSGTDYAKSASYTANEGVTLYAQWKKDTVTVTWMNGETQLEQKNIEYNTVPSYTGETPTKAADAQYTYTFVGWSTNSNATAAETLTAVTADTTYYAVYTSKTNTYTVTWYPQAGGDALETDSNVEYGTKPSYDGENPTKAQDDTYTYTFAGWATSANQETGTLEENLTAITGDTQYYAAFSKTERVYTVSFSDGTTAITGGYNATITLPSTAADKTGYTFTGWNTNSDGTGTTYGKGASYTVTGDVTLYAQYTANTYTVSFNANGGEGTMSEQTFTYDVAQKLTANGFTAPTGKTFNGWNTQANGTGTIYNNEQEVSNLIASGEITLYAQWTDASYTVSKGEVQNGSFTVSKEKANYNEAITVTVTPAVGYSIGTVTYTPENGTAITIDPVEGAYSFIMPAANVTVNATFTAIDYTVTVNSAANGEVTANKTTGVHYGETITLTVTPATGYKLSALTYTDASGVAQNVTVSDGAYSFTMPAANTTVSATFVGIDYTIKFNSNGGDGNMNDNPAVYDTEYTPTNVFTKTGYTFSGWNTKADGTGTAYAKDAKISNLTTTDGDTVTLYAQWTAAQVNYTVNYWLQNVGGDSEENSDNFTKQDADSATKTATADSTITVAPEKTYTGFTTPAEKANVTINADGSTVVDFYYTRNSYTITFKDGETTIASESVQYGAAVTAPADPTKNGYTFKEWSPAVPSTMPDDDTEISATWDIVTYTITYMDGENTLKLSPATYTIISTDKLPTYSKTNYIFKGWKVTETVEGSTVWAKDAVFSAETETAVTDKYGNVTLTAVWEEAITYAIDDYKYAQTGYKMLRIATDSNSNAYTFDGATMYYTKDSNYLVSGSAADGVFYTLISETYVSNGNLTEAGMAKLVAGTEAAKTIDYTSGDINGDDVVNIADANIVYQMIVNGGGYYTDLSADNRSDTESRLMADMHKEAADTSVARATIDDVHAIVNIINGTTN